MAQTELFQRYLWLLDLIYRHDGITRDQINLHWSRSHLNNDKEPEIPERTFHRHKEAIKELFDIDILCDRHGEKTYHIARKENLKDNGAMDWLLNSFSMSRLLSECNDLRHRILFEKVPAGLPFISTIVKAMHEGRILRILYQSFHMDSAAPHDVEPYCLKLYRQRWYLVGRRPERNVMRTFALDRIKGIELTDEHFTLPEDFDAEEYFISTVGIVVEDDCEPQRIIIEAANGMEHYLRSLPLHTTQQEEKSGPEGVRFSIFAQPNNDLVKELLRYGPDITVVSPLSLRDRLRQIIHQMQNNYKES